MAAKVVYSVWIKKRVIITMIRMIRMIRMRRREEYNDIAVQTTNRQYEHVPSYSPSAIRL